MNSPSKEQPPRKNSLWPFTTHLFTAPIDYFDRGRTLVMSGTTASKQHLTPESEQMNSKAQAIERDANLLSHQPYVLTLRITFTVGIYDTSRKHLQTRNRPSVTLSDHSRKDLMKQSLAPPRHIIITRSLTLYCGKRF